MPAARKEDTREGLGTGVGRWGGWSSTWGRACSSAQLHIAVAHLPALCSPCLCWHFPCAADDDIFLLRGAVPFTNPTAPALVTVTTGCTLELREPLPALLKSAPKYGTVWFKVGGAEHGIVSHQTNKGFPLRWKLLLAGCCAIPVASLPSVFV